MVVILRFEYFPLAWRYLNFLFVTGDLRLTLYYLIQAWLGPLFHCSSDLAIHGGAGPGPMQIKETNGLTITGQIRLFTYVTAALGSAPFKTCKGYTVVEYTESEE